jgi:uncharacterized protein
MDLINDPWPWYVAGPLIGLFIPLLLTIGNKSFGISSSFKHICAACLPVKKIEFFNYDWKDESWNIVLVAGVLLGALITGLLIDLNYEVAISKETKLALSSLNITNFYGFIPTELFNWETLSLKPLMLLIGGGFLVGFGTRYANGCTSGHAIMGLSLLSFGSLIAVIGFFIGGLIMTHILFTLIF